MEASAWATRPETISTAMRSDSHLGSQAPFTAAFGTLTVRRRLTVTAPSWGCAHTSGRLWAEATQLEQDPVKMREREKERE